MYQLRMGLLYMSVFGMLSFSTADNSWADDYLNALTEEAESGGAKVDDNSLKEIDKTLFEGNLKKKFKAMYPHYSALSDDRKLKVRNEYQTTKSWPKTLRKIFELKLADEPKKES